MKIFLEEERKIWVRGEKWIYGRKPWVLWRIYWQEVWNISFVKFQGKKGKKSSQFEKVVNFTWDKSLVCKYFFFVKFVWPWLWGLRRGNVSLRFDTFCSKLLNFHKNIIYFGESLEFSLQNSSLTSRNSTFSWRKRQKIMKKNLIFTKNVEITWKT